MKRGDTVWVCQDGKWSRRVEGVVVSTRQCHHIVVTFIPSSEEHIAKVVARKGAKGCKNLYGGWSYDSNQFCPWYRIFPLKYNPTDLKIVQRWELEEAFKGFKNRGSNGKHKFKNAS